MSACKHGTLLLVKSPPKKRCQHCHLTLTADDLGDGYCPECYETHGRKLFDFEEIHESGKEYPQYVCEACGVLIGPPRG